MNTYSKKYFNKETGKWEPLYSTEGMSAYEAAKLNGFTGTEEEFNEMLSELPSTIDLVNEWISNLETLVVDNLTSDDPQKALSARQGKILKSLIDALKSFSIIVLQEGEDLPETGNENTIYFKKKDGSDKDIYNEYIYIESNWELIGSTETDLSNYYTKDQVYSKSEVDEKIPDLYWSDYQ